MDPEPRNPRRWEFSKIISRRMGGYAHVEPDEGRPRMTERTYSIPRKSLPRTPTVSSVTSNSFTGSTVTVPYDDFDREVSSKLKRDSSWYLAFSVAAALAPCVFVALAIVTAQLDGKPLSEWGDKVKSAILLVPTIYPVLFAALVSKSLRALALDLATRGTTLGRLEQLLGSGTVGGTLTTAVFLRLVDVSTILLILLWALSPLGGQAALRMLESQRVVIARSPATVWYLHSDSEPWVSGASGLTKVLPRVNAMYIAALLAPKSSHSEPLDLYGKMKIPRIEPMEASEPRTDGWFPVDSASVRYSSLIGVPFQILPEANASATGSFTMESSYFHFDCKKPTNLSQHMIPSDVLESMEDAPDNIVRSVGLNATAEEYESGRMENRTGVSEPRMLDFISRMDVVAHEDSKSNTRYYAYSQCSMTTTYVESNITCVDTRCAVSDIRRTRRPHAPEYLSVLDGPGKSVSLNFYREFSVAGGTTSSAQVTPTERYIAGMEDRWSLVDTLGEIPDISAVDKDTFSERLGTLFNTYWIGFQAPLTVTATPGASSVSDASEEASLALSTPDDKSTLGGKLKSFDAHSSPFFATNSSAIFVRDEEQYTCKWYWLASFGGSAIILTVISLVGVVCQLLRIAPDIFWVSGLVRDTPYVRVGGKAAMSTLNGCEKTKLLKKMEVMIVDVEPQDEVGKVSLVAVDGNMGEKVEKWRKLEWKRRYR